MIITALKALSFRRRASEIFFRQSKTTGSIDATRSALGEVLTDTASA
jgi:hypothetical protein